LSNKLGTKKSRGEQTPLIARQSSLCHIRTEFRLTVYPNSSPAGNIPVEERDVVAAVRVDTYKTSTEFAEKRMSWQTISVRDNAGVLSQSSHEVVVSHVRNALLASKCRILVAGIAPHAVVYHVLRLGDAVAPERLGLDREISDDTADGAEKSQRDGSAIAVGPRGGRKEIPPRLHGEKELENNRN
jgi:hypothetical protein